MFSVKLIKISMTSLVSGGVGVSSSVYFPAVLDARTVVTFGGEVSNVNVMLSVPV